MKAALISLVVGCINLLIVVAAGIVVMIYGWGIQPQSWLIIIGGYVIIALSSLLTGIVQKVLE